MPKRIQNINNAGLPISLFAWVAFWLVSVGGTIYVLPHFIDDETNSFLLRSSYFLACAIAAGYIYRIDDTFPHHANFSKQLPLILIQGVFFIGLCFLIELFFPITDIISAKIMESGFHFPLFRISPMITKFFDISFQQLMIFALLRRLKKIGSTDGQAMKYFSICFFAVHVPLLFNMKLFALYFIIPSFFAGFIFSYLILKYRFGLVKSFAVHFLFYLLVSLMLRYVVF